MIKKTKKGIQVILTKDIQTQGKQGTLIKVKPGYFRNYIIPLKFGKKATLNLVNQLDRQQKELSIQKLQFTKKCIENKNLLESLEKFKIKKKVGEKGKIFGKITDKQILELLKSTKNLTLDLTRNQIQLPEIKQVGNYNIDIFLTKNIIAKIGVEILAE